jgi:MerR family transcriptional regulator, copper efflux regulator
MGEKAMKTGELAKRAGVNIQTIRFYEREGLLRAPGRTRSGYRAYEKGDLNRVLFIKQCQQLGFTLADVKEVNRLHRVLAAGIEAGLDSKAQRELLVTARSRRAAIDERIAVLEKLRSGMDQVVKVLEGRAAAVCPAGSSKAA